MRVTYISVPVILRTAILRRITYYSGNRLQIIFLSCYVNDFTLMQVSGMNNTCIVGEGRDCPENGSPLSGKGQIKSWGKHHEHT